MKVGDRVFVLQGLDVEEWEIYQEDAKGPWMRRAKGFGVRAENLFYKPYATLDEAVAASKAAREQAIKRCARQLERLALNSNVKVKMMKLPPKGKAE